MRLAWAVAAAAIFCFPGGAARTAPIDFCFTAWPPFAALEDGKPSGLSVEVLTRAAARTGFTASFTELPWARCLRETASGRFDAALDGNPERQEYLHGRHSTTPVAIAFWVREDAAAQAFTGYDQFAGQAIGHTLGYNYVEAAMTALKGQLVVAPDDAAEIAMLTAGRVDAIIGDLVVIGDLARRMKAPIRPLSPPAAETSYYPLFNPDRADKLARIDSAIGEMIAGGEVDTIFRDRIGISHGDILRSLSRPAATN
jgi:ABC-type amino acid transport substrate-binding protein